MFNFIVVAKVNFFVIWVKLIKDYCLLFSSSVKAESQNGATRIICNDLQKLGKVWP